MVLIAPNTWVGAAPAAWSSGFSRERVVSQQASLFLSLRAHLPPPPARQDHTASKPNARSLTWWGLRVVVAWTFPALFTPLCCVVFLDGRQSKQQAYYPRT